MEHLKLYKKLPLQEKYTLTTYLVCILILVKKIDLCVGLFMHLKLNKTKSQRRLQDRADAFINMFEDNTKKNDKILTNYIESHSKA